jgi:sulfate adenylyltransferase subunit 1
MGRLLFEVKAVPEDQLRGAMVDGKVDYSRLTDGLEDERTQGITIDAAYRYFRHNGRYYRIADTPGHIQYVRNMAVAAANSDCAMILIDAAHGVREQTVRHSKIAAFFGIRHFVIAVNKMDLVNYSEDRFKEIEADYRFALADHPGLQLTFIPVSALQGDNITGPSKEMSWHKGTYLMDYLEKLHVPPKAEKGVRLPVQSIIRIGERRGYQGMLTGGNLRKGERVLVAANGNSITITGIYHSGKKVEEAASGQAVTLETDDDVDIARGDVLYGADAPLAAVDMFVGDVLWLDHTAPCKGDCACLLKIHNREVEVEVQQGGAQGPIVSSRIYAASPVEIDLYRHNPATGLFILIEKESEKVIGVGTVVSLHEGDWKREDSGNEKLKHSAYF